MSAGTNISEVEMSVLGSLLCNNNLYERMYRVLFVSDFSDPINALIYDEIEIAIRAGEQADAVTLWPRLVELGIWDKEGWREYLCELLVSMRSCAIICDLRDEIIAASDARREQGSR